MENLNDNDWTLIEKYLRGTATDEEQREVGQKQTDTDFQVALHIQQDVFTAIEIEGDRSLKARLQQKEAELQKQTSGSKIRPLRRRWLGIMAVAAAVLLVLTFAGIQFWGDRVTPDDLFTANFEPFTAVAESQIQRGQSDAVDAQMAYTAFLEGNYETAIAQFEALLTDKDDAVLQFHLAQTLLANSQVQRALPILQQLDTQPAFPLAEQTDWYLALALLETGDTEAARQQLETITNQIPTTYKHTEAQHLLDTL